MFSHFYRPHSHQNHLLPIFFGVGVALIQDGEDVSKNWHHRLFQLSRQCTGLLWCCQLQLDTYISRDLSLSNSVAGLEVYSNVVFTENTPQFFADNPATQGISVWLLPLFCLAVVSALPTFSCYFPGLTKTQLGKLQLLSACLMWMLLFTSLWMLSPML